MPKKQAGRKQQKAPEKHGDCPLCSAQKYLEDAIDKNTTFFIHMHRARIEFLEGIKSLIDGQIQAAKNRTDKAKKKATKIQVTD